MNLSSSLIKRAKYKFLIYLLLTVCVSAFFSLSVLNYHDEAILKQEAMQRLYSTMTKQVKLISEISTLSEEFDLKKDGTEKKLLDQEFMKLIIELDDNNKLFYRWLTQHKFSDFETIEELLENKGTKRKMIRFIQRARSLVKSQNLNEVEIKNHIHFLSRNSREGLGEIFEFISNELATEQQKSFASLSHLGIILAVVSIFQLLFIWLLVFRPLYATILSQNEKISDSLLKAESASRSKTDFLSNISHEIRTPMTAILGYADILTREITTSEERIDAGRIINQNATHLLSLIDEILDISKIEAGKFEFVPEKIDLSTFLNEVYSLINVKAKDKNIELIFKNKGPIPEKIEADNKRMKQVLFNLLGNAIKFTNEGHVELVITFNQKKQILQFTINDTGIGIAKDNFKKLFTPFGQAESSSSRTYGGTGLGLVLSRGLARGMEGDVKLIRSTPGIGTTFVFEIHIDQVEKENLVNQFTTNIIEDVNAKVDNNILKNTRVLVVDDAKENARLFKMYLAQAGAEVFVATDGQGAIDQVRNHAFDLVLLDLQMPGMDGYQVITKLREHSFFKPIVALTAHAMYEEKEKTKKAGFDAHITKPVEPNVLINSVYQLVDSTNRDGLHEM